MRTHNIFIHVHKNNLSWPRMDANKDVAFECLSRAKAAFGCGDLEKARRMTEKSIKLFPTKEAEGISSK